MRCKTCGTENAEGVTICVSCGNRVSGSAGAQVWPKDPKKLTEFKPAEPEKREPELESAPVQDSETEPEFELELTPVLEPLAEVTLELESGSEFEPGIESELEPEPVTGPEVETRDAGEEAQAEAPEEAQDSQDTTEADEPSSESSEEPKRKKSWRPVVIAVAVVAVVAAIVGALLFFGQQASKPSPTDAKSYAGEWVLVEGDEASLSKSNVAELKERGLECTLVLAEDGTGSLDIFSSGSMSVEWSIDDKAENATGTVEGASVFDLNLTDNGIALVDTSGKAMRFERR